VHASSDNDGVRTILSLLLSCRAA